MPNEPPILLVAMPALQARLVIAWLAIGFGLSLPLEILVHRHPPRKPYSLWCAIASALVTLPVAIVFSPTVVMIGWFGFPAPSGLVLLYCAFDHEFRANNGELIRQNLSTALLGFGVFWLIAWCISFARRSRKLQGRTRSGAS